MTRPGFRIPALVAGLALLLLSAAACGPASSATPSTTASESVTPSMDSQSPAATSSAASESASPSDEQGPFACNLPINGVGSTKRAQITDVRVGEHDAYDRITFEFATGIPEFSIEEAEPPFTQDASGLPLEVDGSYFWKIVLRGGTKVSPDGGITYDGPTEFTPGYAKLVHLVEGGDFEAVSTWYVGMSGTSCIRVATLNDPARLVIDIEH